MSLKWRRRFSAVDLEFIETMQRTLSRYGIVGKDPSVGVTHTQFVALEWDEAETDEDKEQILSQFDLDCEGLAAIVKDPDEREVCQRVGGYDKGTWRWFIRSTRKPEKQKTYQYSPQTLEILAKIKRNKMKPDFHQNYHDGS